MLNIYLDLLQASHKKEYLKKKIKLNKTSSIIYNTDY